MQLSLYKGAFVIFLCRFKVLFWNEKRNKRIDSCALETFLYLKMKLVLRDQVQKLGVKTKSILLLKKQLILIAKKEIQMFYLGS